MDLNNIIRSARGEKPADLLLTNARILNVFSGEIVSDHIAVAQGYIIGFGGILPDPFMTLSFLALPVITSNYRALSGVHHHAKRFWRYWLSRRSHKGYINWEKFLDSIMDKFPLPMPRIIHYI